MEMVRVVNKHDHTVRGRYDGKDYVFPSKKPVDIPVDAAAHIFAFGRDSIEDKTRALNMLGFLPTTIPYHEALPALNKFQFLEGKFVYEDDDDLLLNAPTENGRARVKLGGEGEGVLAASSPDSPRRVAAPPPR